MESRKNLKGFFIFLLLTAANLYAASIASPIQMLDVPSFLGYVENEFIIVLKEDAPVLSFQDSPAGFVQTNRRDFDAAAEKFVSKQIKKQFVPIAQAVNANPVRQRLSRHYKVKFEKGTLEEAMEAYRQLLFVEHVEPIGIHTVYLQPNDPYYKDSTNPDFLYDQWHYWDSAGIDSDLAWDIETGDPDVVVAVLDTGVRYFHKDLGGNNPLWTPAAPKTNGNIWVNPGEIPGNVFDDDLNGYIDDTIGWDFVSSTGGIGIICLDQDCGGIDNDPDDGHGHGTHIAGTIAAITNNSRGVAGIAGGFSNGAVSDNGNGVKIIPLRIGYRAQHFGQITGIVQMDWAAEAIVYITDLIDRHNINVAAINCSWGSSNSGGIDAAINNLLSHDVMIIHAAGNDNSSSADYLGLKPGVMNVAATNQNAQGASFTNYGPWVDLAAPGVDILSTTVDPEDPNLNNHYIEVISGTSMSTSHACGVAALLESYDCALTGPEKFDLMVNNTNPYSDSRDLGSGIIDAQKALQAVGPLADINNDSLIDFRDVWIISDNWLATGSCTPGDINHDNIVNLLDFAEFAFIWQL